MKAHVLNFLCALASVICVYWYFEPYPYDRIDVVNIKVDEDRKGAEISAFIIKNKPCPYVVERTMHDSKGRKIYSELSTQPPSGKTNVVIKGFFPVTFTKQAAPGPAVDKVRLGAMCNPVQEMFPNWGAYINTPFEVK